MSTTIIEGLVNWFAGFSVLDGFSINVDWRGDDFNTAGIITDNTETLRMYLSGSSVKLLHASLYLGRLSENDLMRINNIRLGNEVKNTAALLDKVRDLPILPQGFQALGIETDEGEAFEYDDDGRKCTYRIPIRLEYYEEAV